MGWGGFLLSAPDSIPSGQPRVCPSLLFFILRVNKREGFAARGLIPLSSWPGDNRNLFTPKIAVSAVSRGGLQFVHMFSLSRYKKNLRRPSWSQKSHHVTARLMLSREEKKKLSCFNVSRVRL